MSVNWRARRGEAGPFVRGTNAARRTPRRGRESRGCGNGIGAPEGVRRDRSSGGTNAARRTPRRGRESRGCGNGIGAPEGVRRDRSSGGTNAARRTPRRGRESRGCGNGIGAPEGIRTPDFHLRRVALYPAELRALNVGYSSMFCWDFDRPAGRYGWRSRGCAASPARTQASGRSPLARPCQMASPSLRESRLTQLSYGR